MQRTHRAPKVNFRPYIVIAYDDFLLLLLYIYIFFLIIICSQPYWPFLNYIIKSDLNFVTLVADFEESDLGQIFQPSFKNAAQFFSKYVSDRWLKFWLQALLLCRRPIQCWGKLFFSVHSLQLMILFCFISVLETETIKFIRWSSIALTRTNKYSGFSSVCNKQVKSWQRRIVTLFLVYICVEEWMKCFPKTSFMLCNPH